MKIALSLFDGMSCGQLALRRAGISVDYYLASEVETKAIEITMSNFPGTIQMGDVRELDGSAIVNPHILMGGSPCQCFSFAGKRKGMATTEGEEITTLDRYLELKKDGFEFEGQSYLFWEYVRILRETKPKYFLLENVMMAEKWAWVISDILGVKPIRINSTLVSAQKRDRLYWTNIPGVELPKDKGVQLQDILENGYSEKSKSWCMLNSWNRFPKKMDSVKKRYARSMMPVVFSSPDFDWSKGWRPLNRSEGERLQTVPENYTRVVSEKDALGILGNGWTVDVIAHILSHIPEEEK
jgi:DNA (cytosine-5)-methyltransferase 3A